MTLKNCNLLLLPTGKMWLKDKVDITSSIRSISEDSSERSLLRKSAKSIAFSVETQWQDISLHAARRSLLFLKHGTNLNYWLSWVLEEHLVLMVASSEAITTCGSLPQLSPLWLGLSQWELASQPHSLTTHTGKLFLIEVYFLTHLFYLPYRYLIAKRTATAEFEANQGRLMANEWAKSAEYAALQQSLSSNGESLYDLESRIVQQIEKGTFKQWIDRQTWT